MDETLGLEPVQPSTRAYVDLWRQEQSGCEAAFEKWEKDASGLMSAPTACQPPSCVPILPVVREKDRWRYKIYGTAYKVRLCADFKNGGRNERFSEWKFRYWDLQSVAQRVRRGDWLAKVDISRFYLRLPTGERLRAMQWFQDPATYAPDSNGNDRLPAHALRYRQLLSVAFGLKPAPAYASAVSAEAARILESFGIEVVGLYIDDILIRGSTREECQRKLDLAIAILTALGLPPNEKTEGPCAPEQGIVFLGVHICTADGTMTVTADSQAYACARLQELLKAKVATVKELESVAGILSWMSQVFIRGQPRRKALFRAISAMQQRGDNSTAIRGDLKQCLMWWLNVLRGKPIASSFFWDVQPNMPLIVSDASGEDGWGACGMGFHVVGNWPEAWRQSRGPSAPGMLFKELLPVVVITLLLAPWCSGMVFASALDNAGAAFVLNALNCNCQWSLALLRPLVDSLSFNRLGLIAGHSYREFNSHTDEMSHVIPADLWCDVVQQAPISKTKRMEVHFLVHDMHNNDSFVASMSFELPSSRGVSGA